MARIYRHYGSDAFDSGRFDPIRNDCPLPTKPYGGLWATLVDSTYGWQDFCTDEDFNREKLNQFFDFELADWANVLCPENEEDIASLPVRGKSEYFETDPIDFEALAQEYDAIFIDFENTDVTPYDFPLWDVSSLLVFNPDAVLPL